jgi:DNA-binding GntR family transcriptional regulator
MPPHGATRVLPEETDTKYPDWSISEPLLESDGAPAPLSPASSAPGSVSIDTLVERAYARLRYALIIGQLAPGERTTLGALARQLGTSITPVRDAMSRLAAADALYQNRQSGVVVPALSRAELDELLRLRLALEGLAFTDAAPHHRVADWRGFKVLQADLCRVADRADPVRFAAGVWSLRVVILGLARSTVLAMLVDRIWCRLGPTFTQMAADAEKRRQVACHLGKIVTAIGNRDLEEARRAVLDEIVAGTAPRSSTVVDELLAPPLAPIATTACRKPAGDCNSGADHV